MTSELKSCPFCGASSRYHVNNKGDERDGYMSIHIIECIGCGIKSEYYAHDYGGKLTRLEARNKVHEVWNTRAVPDVPELVRYDKSDICLAIENGFDPLPSDDGEYVLHSQAAEIIAALKVELHDMRQDRDRALEWRDYDKERAEAAEAKLAQYEAQEPVGYTDNYGLNGLLKNMLAFIHVSRGCSDDNTVPLYASPAPAADLKAENERHKHALEFYADKANWESGDFQHSVDEHLGHNVLTLNMPQAVNDQGKIARAALNLSEPQT